MATRPIDEKIVAMKMDNSDFVKKASETTKSMGALTNFLNKIPGINFGKTTGQLDNIKKSVNGIDVSRLGNAIDTVTSRFSAMGIVGATALMNITNRVIDASIAMARKITVAPIMDGFREYELQMGSIQTILANTAKYGTTVSDVSKALNELNLYADKTIYNFGEMTRNIGLFTNAGLGLEDSVSMIKGFSNAAAASGTGSAEAARAAYQLSQALSQGYVMQMDWMSISNAGMGNDNMKRDLIALGQAMGTLKVSTGTAIKDWKALLSDEKWLTTDVMSTYLRAMAGELDFATLKTLGLSDAQAELLLQNAKTGEEAATYVRTFTQMMSTLVEGIGSGWSETFSIMFGGFEEGTKLWSGFSKLINEPFDKLTKSRNDFFTTLKDAGVFEEIFVGIGTAIYLVGQVIGAVTDGFDKAFSSDRVGIVSSLVQAFKNVVSALTPSQASLDKISTIFTAIGSNVRLVLTIIGKLGGAFLSLIPDNLGSSLLNMLEKLAKLNIAFNKNIVNSQGVKLSFEGLGKVFSWIGDRVGNVIGGFSKLGDRISEVWTILKTGEAATNGAFSADSKIVVWLAAIGSAAKSVIKSISSIELSMTPIINTFKSFFSAVGSGFDWFKEKVSGTGEAIQSIMPNGRELMAGGFIAGLVAISAVVLKTVYNITKIFSEWGNVVKGFADTLDSVSGALDAFAINLHAKSLLTAAFAVGVLAAAIFLLSKVDGSKIGTSLTAIVGSLSAVIGALAIMSKYDISGGFKTSASIVGIAIALSIMSVALKKFGDLKPEELTKGLISVVVLLGSIAGAFALMGKFNDKEITVTAAQFVAMSVSIMIIAKAVKDMGSMNISELAKGIGGLVLLIGAITGAFVLMGKYSGAGASASALQFLAIAGSVILLVGAIKLIANINIGDLLIGLGTITLILAAIAGFATLTSGTGLLASSVGLIAISIAMNALLIPILALGNFPIGTLITGLLGMSGALLAIAAASKVMKGSLAGAASITIMAVALNLLLVPITAFAAMGWGPMLVGVAGLALSLGALAGVSLLLAAGVVPMLGFAAAIGLMGLAMVAAGLGMTLFSTGLLALAGMTSAAVATLLTTIGALVTGIMSLLPTFLKFVYDVLLDVITVIRDKAPGVINSFVDMMVSVLNTITNRAPDIIDAVARLLFTILDKIAEYIPKYVAAVVKMITSLIDAIAEEAPKLIKSVVNLLITLVETMATTIDENGPKFVNAFLKLVGSILTLIVETGASVIKAMLGWVPGIEKAMNEVGDKAGVAIEKALDSAKIGEDKGKDFAKGISKQSNGVKKSAEELSTTAYSGLVTMDTKNAGSMFATNFASGISSRQSDVEQAAESMAFSALKANRERLGIHSNADETISDGQYVGGGFIEGMDNTSGAVANSAKNMGNTALSALDGVTSKVRGMLFLKDSDIKDQEKKSSDMSKKFISDSDDTTKAKEKNSKKVKNQLSEQFTKAKELIDEQKYYLKMSLDEELKAWQKIQKQYKKGTEERKQADREVFRVQQEIIKKKEQDEKDKLSRSKQFLDEEKYYQRLSLDEELKAWQRVQKQYKEGSEQRKEADREVFRLQKELVKQKEELEKASLDRSKQYISDRKYYNELSLVDELATWERVQARYKVGTEERKEADREVYRLKNDINKQLIQLNEEYTSKVRDANKALVEEERRLQEDYAAKVKDTNKRLIDDELKLKEDYERSVREINDRLISEERRLTDEYNKAVDDRARSLVGFAGLFDAAPEKSKTSGDQLVNNLKGQIDSFSSWSDSINELSEKGIEEGLLSELRNMGPKAAGEIEALNSLTEEQLTEYSNLWKTKNELARTQAIKELDTLKQDTNSKIEELRSETGVHLEALKNQWLTMTLELRTETAKQLEAYKTEWLTKTEQLRTQTAKQLTEYKDEWLKKIKQLSEGTKDEFVSLSTSMKTIGEDTIKGMIKGMESMEGALMLQAKEMADSVAATIKSALKIKSPSKVTEALGVFTGEGLAEGIASQVRNVSTKAKDLALTAKDSLNKFLGGFGLPEEDSEIRIKAVVVWDGFDPTDLNAKPLRIMPNNSITTGMIGEIRSSQRQNGNIIPTATTKDSQVVTRDVKIDQHLTFNSRELTPSEVARKNLQASRQLAMQWGG